MSRINDLYLYLIQIVAGNWKISNYFFIFLKLARNVSELGAESCKFNVLHIKLILSANEIHYKSIKFLN